MASMVSSARRDVGITLLLVADALFAGINQAEIGVHRLEIGRRAGNMVRQRADGRARREIDRRQAEHAPRQRNARDEAAGSALHIPSTPVICPAKYRPGGRSCALRVEEARRMEERVSVHHAVAQELRVFKAGIMEKTRFCSPHLSRV